MSHDAPTIAQSADTRGNTAVRRKEDAQKGHVRRGSGRCGADEGLNRLGSFVGAVGGDDASIYRGVLFVALFDIAVLGAALLKKTIRHQVKWTAVALTVPALLLLLLAPGLPVVIQSLMGVAMTLCGLLALPSVKREAPAS